MKRFGVGAVLLVCALGALGWGCEQKKAPEVGQKKADPMEGLRGGKKIFQDEFQGTSLNAKHWNNTAGEKGWTLQEGWLHSEGTRNKALWLKTALPEKVRVEFDARSESTDGDIKVEIFGDGERHESGYILIFGGWRNKLNLIARLDEHGADRQVGGKGIKVEKSKTYRMAVVRTDGKIRWFLDRDKGTLLTEYDDPNPLKGEAHDHFAFNDWSVPLYFDNLAVYDLSGGL